MLSNLSSTTVSCSYSWSEGVEPILIATEQTNWDMGFSKVDTMGT